MQLETKTLRRSINKAFLKETVDRTSFNRFKFELDQLLKAIEASKKKEELEEHFKKPLISFFEEVGFKEYNINTSDRIDLAIHTAAKSKEPVGVLFEVKSPTKKQEMVTTTNFNRKALHQAVLYYLEQRMEADNEDLKHIVITDTLNWFVFDAQEFERCFFRPSALKNVYKAWKTDQKVSSNKDFMYGKIASFIDKQEATLHGLHLNLQEYGKLLGAKEGSDHEKKLIPLYKFFSPIHLLKEPFANDSNTLNREFYRELLYILGLEEVKDGSTRYIERAAEENRQPGSLIENTIRILDAEDHLSTVSEPKVKYGSGREDQLFNVALELGITWMNRILFLKLLEAQLYRYHRQDKKFKFLNAKTIEDYDELNKLFFQVLARRETDRPEDVNEKFGHIPYLNSSLFDPSTLEHEAVFISNLDDKKTTPVYSRSVLKDRRGEELNTLHYLFEFLDAYDFAAEGGEEIQQERKTLINASVLGLIFEKINGYKDGSFFTPGFITEYMARETLRKAVTDKFAEHWGEEDLTFTDIYNRIGRKQAEIEKANEIVNSITICDPAVGSGHFLVSCLNELLAIKSDLGILCDREGKLFHHVNIEIENDELIVTWGDEELFEYDVSHTWQGTRLAKRKIASDRQRIQKVLFHEKRYIIENCLFGVDINPNSVKICRLRLWIELLKNTYYTERSDYRELEVLPNIDINIKTGNSLVSQFELDSDLSSVFKDSEHSLEDYKEAVRNYKHSGDREEKQRLQKLIDNIKEEYSTTLLNNRPINKKLSKQRGRLELMQNSDLFGDKKFTKKEIQKQEKKVKKLEEQKAEEESGAFYNQAFEWRFEFPEVLDEEGYFTGFDMVIGNPPYGAKIEKSEFEYFKQKFKTAEYQVDTYPIFIERARSIVNKVGSGSFIIPSAWVASKYNKQFRKFLTENVGLTNIIITPKKVFEEAHVETLLIFFSNKETLNEFIVERWDKEVKSEYKFNYSIISEINDFVYPIYSDPEIFEIIQKMRTKTRPLSDFAETVWGVKIYQKGKGTPKQTGKESKERTFHSDEKESDSWKPLIGGRNIKKYGLDWSGKYVKYGEWLAEPRSEEWFEDERILVREVTDKGRLTATLVDGDYVFSNSVDGIRVKNKISHEYLLGLLCSKVISFYHKYSSSNAFKDAFPKVLIKDLDSLPIPYSQDLSNKKQNLVNQVEVKVKQILTIKKEDPEADTSDMEAEIDRLVYKLYGLNEEEIEIVEKDI